MKPIAIFSVVLCFCSSLANSAEPIVTLRLDRSELPWKVEVTNHAAEPFVYETINGIPIHLGIEHWESNSGSRLFVGEMAQRQSETRFEPVYGRVKGGGTRIFELDPREVSSESDEDLKSWVDSFEEFKFYEIRIFFEQFASPLIFEPRKPASE